ncbi:MAG: DUF3822 family protein [Crocinitomicaceae bacterium]|nr:DUF3822 family protein [Crocinitomicaceae bacterium]
MSGSHLAIEIASNAVRFVSMRNETVLSRLDKSISGKTDSESKESLKAIFEANSFLQNEFDEVTVAWCVNKSSLVPNSIFNESTPIDIFQLCFGKDSEKGEIDYNRISELSVINVYEVPNWIKSFFVIRFPRVVIQHTGTHIVRKALNENAFKLKATIVCFENYFRLTIVKHNALEFYSSFSYQSSEDIIYHLNFALQQKEFTNEKGSIELVASVGSDASLIDSIEKGIGKIGDLKKMTVSKDNDHIAKSQILCV